MRGDLIFVYVFFLILSLNVSAEITGEAVTGKATQQNFGINISVVVIFPSLNLVSPENKTYIQNQSISLEYSSSSANLIWYNIDNGVNTTLSSNIEFSVSDGNHVLNIYANNTNGLVTKNVSFFVDSDFFVIIDDEFDDEDGERGYNLKETMKGESTDLLDYTYEDLQNLSGIIFERPNFGKIVFNEIINVTDDDNPEDNKLDLDSNINISFNRIELNSTSLNNFNKSATLYIYNLSFSDPRILRDGEICPSFICTKLSYSGGTLMFNVTGFSVYSSEETPTSEIPSGSGGGGGRGISVKKNQLDLDVNKILVSLKQEETTKKEIILRNTGNKKLKINLQPLEIEDFIKVSESDFELNVGESKKIILDIIAGEDVVPEMYFGKLLIRGESIEKEVLILIEIESKKSLFDVKLDISEEYLEVLPGSVLPLEISLYNLGNIKKIDVLAKMILLNSEGKEIVSKSRSIAIETQVSFIEKFKIPDNVIPGDYVVYFRLDYEGEVATATTWISVIREKSELSKIIFYIIICLFIAMIIFLLFFILYKMKKYSLILPPHNFGLFEDS
ncbi:MAG: hypothetical protein ABH811_00575 [archaeon]